MATLSSRFQGNVKCSVVFELWSIPGSSSFRGPGWLRLQARQWRAQASPRPHVAELASAFASSPVAVADTASIKARNIEK